MFGFEFAFCVKSRPTSTFNNFGPIRIAYDRMLRELDVHRAVKRQKTNHGSVHIVLGKKVSKRPLSIQLQGVFEVRACKAVGASEFEKVQQAALCRVGFQGDATWSIISSVQFPPSTRRLSHWDVHGALHCKQTYRFSVDLDILELCGGFSHNTSVLLLYIADTISEALLDGCSQTMLVTPSDICLPLKIPLQPSDPIRLALEEQRDLEAADLPPDTEQSPREAYPFSACFNFVKLSRYLKNDDSLKDVLKLAAYALGPACDAGVAGSSLDDGSIANTPEASFNFSLYLK